MLNIGVYVVRGFFLIALSAALYEYLKTSPSGIMQIAMAITPLSAQLTCLHFIENAKSDVRFDKKGELHHENFHQ